MMGWETLYMATLTTLYSKTRLTLRRTGMPDSNSATSLLFFWLAVIELSRFIPPDIFDCCDCIECKWGGSDF